LIAAIDHELMKFYASGEKVSLSGKTNASEIEFWFANLVGN
jgi:hypothetical protein